MTNTYLADAYAAIPGYDRAQQAVATTARWLQEASQFKDRQTVAATVAKTLQAAAENGTKQPPLDAIDELIDFDRIAGLEIRRLEQLRAAHDTAQDRARRLVRTHVDDAYTVLAGHLTKLYREVDKHRGDLTGSTTAEAAIRSGTPTAFTQGDDLCRRYEQIRAAHAEMLRIEDPAIGTPALIHAGQIRNAVEHEPYWHSIRRRSATQVGLDHHSNRIADHLGWLKNAPATGQHDRRSTIWPDDRPHLDWLLLLAEHEPFVPDAAELHEHMQLCEQACVAPIDEYTHRAATIARAQLAGELVEH